MSAPGTETLRKTSLFDAHARLGARFTDFGGWKMPLQYTGVIEEHRAVREQVGLFDVSHMGEIAVRGPRARDLLQRITSNDMAKLNPGGAQYSLLLNDRGGVVDDIIVYERDEKNFLLCVNAGNRAKDVSWVKDHNLVGAEIEDISDSVAQVALQGPRAVPVLERFIGEALGEFPAFRFRECRPEGFREPLLIARTGYTGEDGFEIFCAWEEAPAMWDRLLEDGSTFGIKPAGLGARDTLRLEVCYPLYGHELRDDIDALSSGVGWVVKFAKGDFIGRAALLEVREQGSERTLVGLEALDRGILREGHRVFDGGGREVGWITSGTLTPTVQRAVALAFVPPTHGATGTELFADVRGKQVRLAVVRTPFYKRKG